MRCRWWPERWTTGRLMVWLAIGSTVLGAWVFSRNYGTGPRAWANHNAYALLHAPTPRDRANSAQILGEMIGFGTAGPSVLDALAASSGGDADPSVRAASVRALGGCVDPWVVDPIRRALADPSPEVHLAALLAMSRSWAFQHLAQRDPAEAEALAETARRSLSDPNAPTRWAALYLLATLPAVDAPGEAEDGPRGRLEALAMLERDPDRSNRALALRTLVLNWPDRSLYPILIRRLESTDDPEERATIAKWSAQLPAPSSATLATLVEMMDRDVHLTPMVAIYVGMLDRETARPYLPAIARAARREAEAGVGPLQACVALFRLDPGSTDADEVAEALRKLAASNPDIKTQVDAALQARDWARVGRELHDMKPDPTP